MNKEKNNNLFSDKVCVITGGASGIGKCIREEFEKEGAKVYYMDIAPNPCFIGDVGKETDLRNFAKLVVEKEGRVDFLINNAPPLFKGIESCTYEQFNYALRVGVSSAFLLTQLFLPYFSDEGSIVNISSSREKMSQPQSESYAAAKGALGALTHALAVSLGGKVRVNSISPGWIDVEYKVYEGADALQQPVKRVGNPIDIANMVLFLCSHKAGFITGENITIDGGQSKVMVYHNDWGWTYKPES